MNRLLKSCTVALALVSATATAAPQYLSTQNNTGVWSNAFIDGVIPSTHPSAPQKLNNVPWFQVIMACTGHIVNKKCSAVIKMETNTANPVTLGTVTMDLNTGDITPKQLSANGYTLNVTAPGKTVLSKSN